jgi:hypothetical protein
MSEGNGVFRIAAQGEKKFQIGDSEPFNVDIIDVYNKWFTIDQEFKDGKGGELSKYQDLISEVGGPPTTKTEAILFIQAIVKQAEPILETLKKNSQLRSSSAESTTVSTPSN